MASEERGDKVLFPARDGRKADVSSSASSAFVRLNLLLYEPQMGKKITLKNRQLPLATQAKYTLIDLSVLVRSTVVQNI